MPGTANYAALHFLLPATTILTVANNIPESHPIVTACLPASEPVIFNYVSKLGTSHDFIFPIGLHRHGHQICCKN